MRSTVLITGETGVGKELLCREVHHRSGRRGKVVAINCATLPDDLVQSELFGHVKGAFTGADRDRQGRFEYADGGTLFLDEVGDLTLPTQVKLLRVVQDSEFERVGGVETRKVDARLVAATNRDLEEMVSKGDYRADLFYRLNVIPIVVPPIKNRREDIIELCKHYIEKYNMNKNYKFSFSKSAIFKLEFYNWPGNVRELKNVIERSVYRTGNGHIPVSDIIFDAFDSPYRPARSQSTEATRPVPETQSVEQDESPAATQSANESILSPVSIEQPIDLKEQSQQFEIQLLTEALKLCQYNQKRTAKHLGLTYHQLRGYLKKYQLLEGTQ